MENNSRKLILYIAMSLDGFIAAPGDDISFLNMVDQEGEDYGYQNFYSRIDTVVLGRKTYDKVASMGYPDPHPEKKMFVITRQERPSLNNIQFYNGNLVDLIHRLKREEGKDIYCDGGAEIVNTLLKEMLFDELIISVLPLLIGDGTRLFQTGIPCQKLELVSSKGFEKGLVQLHYKMK